MGPALPRVVRRLLARKRPTAADRRTASRLCYVAGILMLLSGTAGSTALVYFGYTVLSAWLPAFGDLLAILLIIAVIIAGLGGFAVLAGGYLVSSGRRKRGTLLITLGVGTGVLSLAGNVLLTTVEGGDPVAWVVAE